MKHVIITRPPAAESLCIGYRAVSALYRIEAKPSLIKGWNRPIINLKRVCFWGRKISHVAQSQNLLRAVVRILKSENQVMFSSLLCTQGTARINLREYSPLKFSQNFKFCLKQIGSVSFILLELQCIHYVTQLQCFTLPSRFHIFYCILLIQTELLFLYFSGILEVDVEEYKTASVLINFLDFHFILQGELSPLCALTYIQYIPIIY